MTVEEFLNEYRALCARAGYELRAAEQRQTVGNVWTIGPPVLEVVQLAQPVGGGGQSTEDVNGAPASDR